MMKNIIGFLLILWMSYGYCETTLNIDIEVPELNVDPYFKPYVAIWLEDENRAPIDTVALWYQVEKSAEAQEDGKKWLKDLRQWWRKIGRGNLESVDGVTGATRRPGFYSLNWVVSDEVLQRLTSNKIILHIEASREEGGRSYQRLTVDTDKPTTQTLQAEGELGLIKLTVELVEND